MRTLLFLLGTVILARGPALAGHTLPRFTEEREAAALHFVKKHLSDLLPLLAELKKSNTARYQQEISEIFQVTELLADLLNEPRRYELELKIWKAENKAHILVARLRMPTEEERKKYLDQLREVARELAELDLRIMEAQIEQLDKELAEIRDQLVRSRDNLDQNAKARFEGLLDKSRKPKK
jgi:hypothetical protein